MSCEVHVKAASGASKSQNHDTRVGEIKIRHDRTPLELYRALKGKLAHQHRQPPHRAASRLQVEGGRAVAPTACIRTGVGAAVPRAVLLVTKVSVHNVAVVDGNVHVELSS